MVPNALRLLAALVACTVCGTAVPAAAQGYHVEAAGDTAVSEPPGGGEELEAGGTAVVTLPFEFVYFGERRRELTVCDDGRVYVGALDVAPTPRWGPFPVDEEQDGLISPAAGRALSGARWWIAGTSPTRAWVGEWSGEFGRVQLQLHEGPGRITLHRTPIAITGAVSRPLGECGIDELGGPRRVVASPADDALRFEPRTVLVNVPDRFEEPVPVTWADVRKESVVPDGCARRCVYLARGRLFFHVPDRAREYLDPRHGRRLRPKTFVEALQEEDRLTFPTADGTERRGDERRWVRQVLDGKIQLLRAEDGEPVRVWFRVVEYYTLDARGIAGADYHTWNLRHTLSAVFPGVDERRPIDRYQAWRARARGRLTVGKLFAADQTDDAGPQFDTGRRNEYLLYAGRVRHGERERLAPAEVPDRGWVRFALQEDDERVQQYADGPGLRFVPDPNHVDGHYDYVVHSETDERGWVFGADRPDPPHHDEPFEVGIAVPSGPTTGR